MINVDLRDDGYVRVWDDDYPDLTVVFAPEQWGQFIGRVKAGELDPRA